nr:VWA domain-containing protein [Spirochaetota bacterium]
MKIYQKLQKRGGVSRLLSKKVKLILLISTLVLLALSYLSTSCSEAAFKAIDEPTTKINTANYITIQKLNEPYTEQPCIVNLIFGLKDYNGNIIPGIYDTSRYNLMENGAPLAYAEAFYRVKERKLFDVELKTLIMIDISLSVGSSNIEKLKNSVKSIINNKSDNQSIAIYTFSGAVTMVKDFSLNKTELITAVDGITLGASSTNLYGSIYDGLDRFTNSIGNKLVTNTFMIVMTDGQDTSAVRTLDEVLTKRGDRSVITIGIGSDVDPGVLKNLGNFGSFIATNFDTLQTYIDSMRSFIAEAYN